MIKSLHISNYALIEELDIDFHSGFNIITGETGAGKSIILGALSLLLGGRADSKAIGDSSRKSVIEASVSVDGRSDLKMFCLENDIDFDENEFILRRELAPSGRSRAFINDSPVNLETLREISLQLVDIHSQHQNLLLASPPYQMRIIDVLAGNKDKLEDFQDKYKAYRAAVREYAVAKKNIEKANADEEFIRYRLAKIKEVAPVAGEQADLEKERDLLSNIGEVKDNLGTLVDSLSDGSPSVLSLLKSVQSSAEALSDVIEDSDSLVSRLEAVRVELKDIADTYSDYDRNLQADPAQLESVEERLNLIYDLERRFHVDSIEEILEIQKELGAKIGTIDNAETLLEELEANARKAKKACVESARIISDARKKEAALFAEELQHKAMPLGMKNLTVRIEVKPADLSATGMDEVEFFFSFNKNQEPLPVGKTASGGEISRLMLAIKSIVADKMELPSIIFDEVDTGVSGDIANRMGQLMQDISKDIQVITITHLPQVAAKGNAHYKVYKEDTELKTTTKIDELDYQRRVDELALMLSGSENDQAARANAESLLRGSI